MTIQGMNFVYDGVSSDIYDVIMVDFESPTPSNDEETSLLTGKSTSGDRWDLYGVEYASPLTSSITIINNDSTYIDTEKQVALKKWLCKNRYGWFQVEQEDMADIYYRCIFNNPKIYNLGRRNAGLIFTMTCDAPYAWSAEFNRKFSVLESTGTFTFNHTSDFDEYILRPVVTITSNTNGSIEIINTSDHSRTVKVDNCVVGEVITIDGLNDKISSSNGRVVINSWNKNFLELIEGKNNLSIKGKCSVNLSYRLPRRVGA